MTIVAIPITKASVAAKDDNPGHVATINVDTSRFSDEMYSLVMFEGLKTVLNARMSAKLVGAVTKKTGKDLADAQAAAMKIAEENLETLYAGNTKAKKAKVASAIPREVQTEARRMARDVVKNEMRKANIKISQVKASEITAAADALIASDPSYVAKAIEAVNDRANITSTIDVSALVKVDPKKVAEAQAKKAEKASQLSKTQAGIPGRRKKPDAGVSPGAMSSSATPSHSAVH